MSTIVTCLNQANQSNVIIKILRCPRSHMKKFKTLVFVHVITVFKSVHLHWAMCMSDNDCHKHIEQNITNNVMLDYNWKSINASNDKEQVKKHQPAWKALQRKWIVMLILILSNWIYEAFLEKWSLQILHDHEEVIESSLASYFFSASVFWSDGYSYAMKTMHNFFLHTPLWWIISQPKVHGFANGFFPLIDEMLLVQSVYDIVCYVV